MSLFLATDIKEYGGSEGNEDTLQKTRDAHQSIDYTVLRDSLLNSLGMDQSTTRRTSTTEASPLTACMASLISDKGPARALSNRQLSMGFIWVQSLHVHCMMGKNQRGHDPSVITMTCHCLGVNYAKA